jgi:hypothetical protein
VTAVIDNSGSMEDLKQNLANKINDPDAWYPTSTNDDER